MLLTFRHGTAPAEQMTGLLRDAGVARLIDVSAAPDSPDVAWRGAHGAVLLGDVTAHGYLLAVSSASC
jgi:hypothetical protein